jgi:isoleucyl-tRNA synthetase
MKDVILDEVNIKELIVLDDDSEIVNKTAKANFKSIGPKFGKKVKAAASAIAGFGKEEISAIESGRSVALQIDSETINVTREDVEIISHEIEGWLVETEEGVTVAIDTELDADLIAEGLAREFVNRIQNLRKDAGLEVTDRISINFNAAPDFVDAINLFKDYVSNETLADKIDIDSNLNGKEKTEMKIGDYQCSIYIEKVVSKT